jgi:hypothetical protein
MGQTSTPISTSTKSSLHEQLVDIQQNLKVPKTRENEFGGFNYRSIEDIEIAVKPFLKKYTLTLQFSDEVVAVGDRVYVKATATLTNFEGAKISSSAYAREAEKPKAKTDDAQLTGGCSSYARKYAAQGLFLIDDGKGDPDTPKGVGSPSESLSAAKAKLFKTFKEGGITESIDIMANIEQALGKDTVETVAEANKVIEYLLKDEG